MHEGGRDYVDFVASSSQNRLQLARIDTNSSVSTNATAPNLPGPGRTVGLAIDWLGAQLEKFINISAQWRGLEPKAIAQEIRRLVRHDQRTITERLCRFRRPTKQE